MIWDPPSLPSYITGLRVWLSGPSRVSGLLAKDSWMAGSLWLYPIGTEPQVSWHTKGNLKGSGLKFATISNVTFSYSIFFHFMKIEKMCHLTSFLLIKKIDGYNYNTFRWQLLPSNFCPWNWPIIIWKHLLFNFHEVK